MTTAVAPTRDSIASHINNALAMLELLNLSGTLGRVSADIEKHLRGALALEEARRELDAAEILADPAVVASIGALIESAAIGYGVAGNHARRVSLSIVDRILEGTRVPAAVALVESVVRRERGV